MNQVGKRFKCESCGSEVLVTKGGEGALHCADGLRRLMSPGAEAI